MADSIDVPIRQPARKNTNFCLRLSCHQLRMSSDIIIQQILPSMNTNLYMITKDLTVPFPRLQSIMHMVFQNIPRQSAPITEYMQPRPLVTYLWLQMDLPPTSFLTNRLHSEAHVTREVNEIKFTLPLEKSDSDRLEMLPFTLLLFRAIYRCIEALPSSLDDVGKG